MMSFLPHTRTQRHTERQWRRVGEEGKGALAHVQAAVDFGQISANTSCFQLRGETCATNLQFWPKQNSRMDSHVYLYSCLPCRGALSLSDKLICISGRSSRSPVSSRPGPAPRLPVCRLSKVYLFDTKKVDTDTSQKKNKYSLPCHTHHASPHLTSPQLGEWEAWGVSGETKSDLFACPKIGLQLSCNYATTKQREGRERDGYSWGAVVVPTTTCHCLAPPLGHSPCTD